MKYSSTLTNNHLSSSCVGDAIHSDRVKWVNEKELIIQDILKFNETTETFLTTVENYEASLIN